MKTYEPNEIIPVDEAILLLRKWGTYSDYIEGRLLDLVGGGISPLGITEIDVLPIAERLWILLREEFVCARDLRLLACRWAEAVLPLFEIECPDDAQPRETIAVARRHADGAATDRELADARAACPTTLAAWPAWAAAMTARATALATGAAREVSMTASWAAMTACWAAAEAARDATLAARDARAAHLADIRAVLEGTAVENLPAGVSK